MAFENAGKGAVQEAEKVLIPELEQDAEKLIGQLRALLPEIAGYEIVVSLRKKTQGES